MLTGKKLEQSDESYLRNIERKQGQSLKDIADQVKEFCSHKRMCVMSERVIVNRISDDVVECKIIVPARQVDDILGSRM